jgi:type I restriction enzyme S subunit
VRIQNLNNPDATYNYYDGQFDSRYYLRGGELLFAWSGTPGTSFGAHIWFGAEAVLNQHIFRVDFDDNTLDKRFFRYAINQKLDELINIAHGGVGLRHVTKGKFEKTEVAIPPLDEQKRIADKLDMLLARVDTCREHLDLVPLILKRFRQSVLTAATSGKLTEEWRAQAVEFLPSWESEKLLELCHHDRVITYGVIKLGNEIPNGVPCLRTSNVRWLNIDTNGMKRISPSISSDYSRTILNGTEVLVNVRGTLGGVAVVTPEMAGWNVSREVAVVPVDSSKINPSFLAYWIGSDDSQRWLGRFEKGVAYIGVNIEDLRKLPVRLPPMDEQLEIVRRVQGLFAYADRLEARYQAARAQVDLLTPTILAKAFRGELVPQDANDEPASTLLERILARRAVVASELGDMQRKGKGKTQRKLVMEVIMLKRQEIQSSHLSGILKTRGPLTAESLWAASQLDIDDFYDQLKDEEARGLLKEIKGESLNAPRMLEAAA